MQHPPKPCLLIILDGWGYRENPENNAIFRAKKPTWDRLWQQCPHTLIRASEAAVGLPSRQMGNSEVGHMNLGAGRVVYQEYTRINRAISSGAFFTNKTLTDAVDLAKDTTRAVHILGLLSPGGVHSHESHIQAIAQLAVERGNKKVYLHAFLDGRDTLPKSAANSIAAMEAKFNELGCGRFASIIGRHYAMDRDHRWPRVQEAYDLLTIGKANYSATSATEALQMAYDRGESDEFVRATSIVPEGSQSVQIRDGDIVIFMNFRSDRARQITRPFIEPDFDSFTRQVWPKLGRFVSLTEYNSEFDVPVAFPAERLKNVFGDYLSQLGKRQLRIAETEKYAHVTFFFNGGVETPFEGEERILIPSPTDVSTYNLKPEMNAELVTDEVCKAITEGDFDAIICNFANPDMVGHTGDFDATVQAIETIDRCLARILKALEKVGGEMLITSDHGNAELMKDPKSSQAHTAHTTNPVPLIYVGRRASIDSSGSLEDVIPTLLHMMGLAIPTEMQGQSLLDFQDEVANT
ncbi:MAG TPA: 2,3-bisphosphoglycerate-independent phosphoglycerate mutase [Acidiferrobacteraceae bacterium]|nr:2,3-bisphosphoglycerate-independent phosphoglycerate mutase [Acidiferrobacteraceae bacterium]HEX20378.1 2,3-bisphosphoglycerate-independent phosphoglycerate mutase [Acidiferrobacteraceae bacterium]